MMGELVDSKIRSHASHPVINWGAPAEPFEKREPDDRPDKGAYLIIISLLSLGLWAAIWAVVASFAFGVWG